MTPPKDWLKMIENIRLVRQKYPAPVDSMGCDQSQYRTEKPIDQRFLVLVSLMLSSQTKDPVTWAATQRLKENGLGRPDKMVEVEEKDLEDLIHPVGFFRRKAKYLKQMCKILLEQHNGDIPNSVEELCQIPGVGPKMAHLCMQEAWNVSSGIGVDTHVHRISARLGWVPSKGIKTPEDTRKALEQWLPREYWREINHMLVGFGQTICTPLRPKCSDCSNSGLCPSSSVKPKGSSSAEQPRQEQKGPRKKAPARKAGSAKLEQLEEFDKEQLGAKATTAAAAAAAAVAVAVAAAAADEMVIGGGLAGAATCKLEEGDEQGSASAAAALSEKAAPVSELSPKALVKLEPHEAELFLQPPPQKQQQQQLEQFVKVEFEESPVEWVPAKEASAPTTAASNKRRNGANVGTSKRVATHQRGQSKAVMLGCSAKVVAASQMRPDEGGGGGGTIGATGSRDESEQSLAGLAQAKLKEQQAQRASGRRRQQKQVKQEVALTKRVTRSGGGGRATG